MTESCPGGRNPSDVFRKHFAKLARSIQDPDGLALELYSEKMITRAVRDNAVMTTLTKQQKSTVLLQAIESKLETDPSDFTTLITVLQSDPTLMSLATRMIQMYRGQTKETPQPQHETRERPRETMKERPVAVRQRNIILLGGTGAGKSSVANHIIGEQSFHVCEALPGYQPECEFIVHMGPGSIQYNLKVLKHYGLFYVEAVEGYINLRRNASKLFPEGVNLVLFVIKNGLFTRDQRETFNILIRENTMPLIEGLGQGISRISALIITNCEGMDDDRRKALVREFHTNLETKEIADFMGKGIYTVGFPDPTCIRPQLMQLYEEDMKEDEETLHQLIYTCDEHEQLPLLTQ